jgi:hypothetical protein
LRSRLRHGSPSSLAQNASTLPRNENGHTYSCSDGRDRYPSQMHTWHDPECRTRKNGSANDVIITYAKEVHLHAPEAPEAAFR